MNERDSIRSEKMLGRARNSSLWIHVITQERALLRRRNRKGREMLDQRHSQVGVRLVRAEKVQNESSMLSALKLGLKSPACAVRRGIENGPKCWLSHLSLQAMRGTCIFAGEKQSV